MIKEESSVFYTDLDTILDTRLGVIQTHYSHLIPSVLKNYQYRWRDEFEGISLEEFEYVYARRGRLELSNSIKTGMIDILLEFACETRNLSTKTPHRLRPIVELNLHPYLLPVKEEKQVMAAFRLLLNETCDIRFINVDPAIINFETVRNTYSMMAMYDGLKWLDNQCVGDKQQRRFCPEVGLLVPALVKDPTVPEFKKDPQKFFKLMTEHLSVLIGCQVIQTQYFSYKIPST